MTGEPILQVKEVTKTFGGIIAHERKIVIILLKYITAVIDNIGVGVAQGDILVFIEYIDTFFKHRPFDCIVCR